MAGIRATVQKYTIDYNTPDLEYEMAYRMWRGEITLFVELPPQGKYVVHIESLLSIEQYLKSDEDSPFETPPCYSGRGLIVVEDFDESSIETIVERAIEQSFFDTQKTLEEAPFRMGDYPIYNEGKKEFQKVSPGENLLLQLDSLRQGFSEIVRIETLHGYANQALEITRTVCAINEEEYELHFVDVSDVAAYFESCAAKLNETPVLILPALIVKRKFDSNLESIIDKVSKFNFIHTRPLRRL